MSRQWLPEVRDTTNPARSRARTTSLALSAGSRGSCGQGDGNLTDARRLASRNRFATCGAILEHQANGVLGHRQRLLLIPPVGDDLRKRGNAHGKAALFFGFEHHSERAHLSHCNFSATESWSAPMVWHGPVLSMNPGVAILNVIGKTPHYARRAPAPIAFDRQARGSDPRPVPRGRMGGRSVPGGSFRGKTPADQLTVDLVGALPDLGDLRVAH